MEQVLSSSYFMGMIFSEMDCDDIENLMRMPVSGGDNIRTLNWAFRYQKSWFIHSSIFF